MCDATTKEQSVEHDVRIAHNFTVRINNHRSWTCCEISLPSITWVSDGKGGMIRFLGNCICKFYATPDGIDYADIVALIDKFDFLDLEVQMTDRMGDIQESWLMPQSLPTLIQHSDMSWSDDTPVEITLTFEPQYLNVVKHNSKGE